MLNVWLIFGCATDCALPPVMAPIGLLTGTAAQVYVVGTGTMVAAVGTPFVGLTIKAVPLQIVSLWVGIKGVGFIVTVTIKVGPVQLPAAGGREGVTV